MFDLVADIARYPEFLPWVSAARVHATGGHKMIADLVVGFAGFNERFTSRVATERPRGLSVVGVSGPLKHLRNDWTFAPDGAGGCIVDFRIDFAFRSRILGALANRGFDRALRVMIAAFEARADALYGPDVEAETGISSSSANSAEAWAKAMGRA